MSKLSRRAFLRNAALTAAAVRLHAQAESNAQATLVLSSAEEGPHMPADFVGLSYEVQELNNPGFFSPANTGLVRAFRELSSHGVLRLGGNTSEFGYWKADPNAPEPKHPATREVAGEPMAQFYSVTPQAIRNLAAFLKVTGWTCLYGIGMGTNTPERAAEEAAYVAKTLGDRLQYFQVGNEVDLFDRHLRDPKTWSSQAYLNEWLAIARAVTARVPSARFGIPDVAGKVEWLTQIADLWPAIENPPHVTTLSHHHYFGGPATNPDVNIPNLLKPETMKKVQTTADTATAAAAKMGVRVRMTEGNTCYRGGKPGVSDVFASALWAANYALLIASNNYSGINLHGGNGKSVANSVGGVLPGDVMLKDQGVSEAEIATHPHPFYTPIGAFGADYVLEPVAYGLKFAGLFSGATLLKTDMTAPLQASGVNATAFAAKMPDGKLSVIVLNKDAERDVNVTLDFGAMKTTTTGRGAKVETLTADALTSRKARIAMEPKSIVVKDGKARVTVAKSSAMRITRG
jgi:hypothetical protein